MVPGSLAERGATSIACANTAGAKKIEEEHQKYEAERERKRLLREQKQKEQEDLRAKMQEELRATMRTKRQTLRQETMKLQIELECIKN